VTTLNNGVKVKALVISGLVAVAALLTTGSAARAQAYNPFQIGASAGVAIPVSDLSNTTNTGYNVTVALGYQPQFLPIGVRAEAAYNQFGFQNGGGSTNVAAFTGNLVLGLPIATFSPYAIGGAGLYHVNVALNGLTGGSDNHFGFDIGGGIKIPFSSSFQTFIEARYNRVTINGGGNQSFVPITVGVMF
jgi:opacity protein-like surface antigen